MSCGSHIMDMINFKDLLEYLLFAYNGVLMHWTCLHFDTLSMFVMQSVKQFRFVSSDGSPSRNCCQGSKETFT
jgi:hypothetical protein